MLHFLKINGFWKIINSIECIVTMNGHMLTRQ